MVCKAVLCLCDRSGNLSNLNCSNVFYDTQLPALERDPWEDLDDSQMNFYEQILCFNL